MTPYALTAFFLGYMVIYAAIKDEAPWDEAVAAFGGRKQGFNDAITGGIAKATASVKTAFGAPKLATWGAATLEPSALAAYKTASLKLGGPIPLTGSYRSFATQAGLFATNKDRYASPYASYHVKGEAIDVRMPVTSAQRAALLAAGWCQSRPSDEPWHFSYNGCG